MIMYCATLAGYSADIRIRSASVTLCAHENLTLMSPSSSELRWLAPKLNERDLHVALSSVIAAHPANVPCPTPPSRPLLTEHGLILRLGEQPFARGYLDLRRE